MPKYQLTLPFGERYNLETVPLDGKWSDLANGMQFLTNWNWIKIL